MGQTAHRANITAISSGKPCEVTTSSAHGYSTHDFVRLTDLNGAMPVHRGEDQLNNGRYRIIVTGDTTFTLQYPVTFKAVDSSTYPPYVSGGYCNLIETNFEYNAE